MNNNRVSIDNMLIHATTALRNARTSLQAASVFIQDAHTMARDSQDETLNTAIIGDYLNTVTQLIAHMDMWKLPVKGAGHCERCHKEDALTRVSLQDGTQSTMLCDECVPIVTTHSNWKVTR